MSATINNTAAAVAAAGSVPLFIDFRELTPEAILPRFLIQVMIILILVRIFGKILSYCRQPPVIGEIIAGIVVGPSVLGYIDGWTNTFYPKASLPYFSLVASIGLILFMFYLGLELDEQLIRRQWKYSFPIASGSIIFPFAVGCLFSLWLYEINNESFAKPVDRVAFILFSGSSMSFTALPVLASILTATRLIATPLGIQAISCAAIDDVMAWTLLALSSSFAKQGNALAGVWTLLLAIAFVLVMVFPVRRSLVLCHEYFIRKNDESGKTMMVIVILVLLAASFVAEEIGIHSFFGAFVAGLVVPKSGAFVAGLAPKIELMTVEFFLPLYFANSGIKTQIGTLTSAADWGTVLAITLVATFAKFTPAMLMTRIVTKRDWKFCTTIGVLMNTRGLVELIALNIGLEAKILSPKLFTMLVIMALATTALTAPLIWLLYQRHYDADLEAHHRRAALSEIRETESHQLEAMRDDETVMFHAQPNSPLSQVKLQLDSTKRDTHDRMALDKHITKQASQGPGPGQQGVAALLAQNGHALEQPHATSSGMQNFSLVSFDQSGQGHAQELCSIDQSASDATGSSYNSMGNQGALTSSYKTLTHRHGGSPSEIAALSPKGTIQSSDDLSSEQTMSEIHLSQASTPAVTMHTETAASTAAANQRARNNSRIQTQGSQRARSKSKSKKKTSDSINTPHQAAASEDDYPSPASRSRTESHETDALELGLPNNQHKQQTQRNK